MTDTHQCVCAVRSNDGEAVRYGQSSSLRCRSSGARGSSWRRNHRRHVGRSQSAALAQLAQTCHPPVKGRPLSSSRRRTPSTVADVTST